MPAAQKVFNAELETELSRYRGLWVAIADGRVRGSGETPVDAAEEARSDGVTNIQVYRVPREDERHAAY